jgi:hypothetical protein
MLKLPLFGKKSMITALEFGLIFSQVAKDRDVVLTAEIVARAEENFLKEIKKYGWKQTNLNFLPLILASFEIK